MRNLIEVKNELKQISKYWYNLCFMFGLSGKLNYLSKILLETETIKSFSNGTYNKKSYIIIVTNQRVIMISDTIIVEQKEISLNQISSISIKNNLSGSTLVISSSSGIIELSNVINSNKIIEAINQKSNFKNETTDIDNFEKIKKLKELLDVGAITQEEFEIKKKELLYTKD